MPNPERIAYYSENAAQLAAQYDGLDRAKVHQSILHLFESKEPLRILDIGSGSGADAKWLAERYGHRVTAVEPSDLFEHARTANAHTGVAYVRDRLPSLSKLKGQEGAFDLVLGIAVLQELDAADRRKSLDRIVSLAKPGGKIALMYPSPPSRAGQHQIPGEEIDKALFDIAHDPKAAHSGHLSLSKSSPDTKGRLAANGEPLRFEERIITVSAKGPGPTGAGLGRAVERAWEGTSPSKPGLAPAQDAPGRER
ncbi:MAG: methyltransferase domain-containing protein [Verrucomicrobium sp.]|nr:methyltransferase domain-containing protein [Verrucomicrobium sp.]